VSETTNNSNSLPEEAETKGAESSSAARASGTPPADIAAATKTPLKAPKQNIGECMHRTRSELGGYRQFSPLLELLEHLIDTIATHQLLALEQSFLQSVLGKHPDALGLREDEEFLGWVQKQPPLVQRCLKDSPNPEDAIWAIGLYKDEVAKTEGDASRAKALANREKRMKAGAAPSPRTSAPPRGARFTRDDIAMMSLDEFKANEANINAALERGEIG